jgi:hypothetical protein
MKNEDSILFEITLHPGNVAVSISDYSVIPAESEILIAASTGFKIEGVEYVDLELSNSDCPGVVRIPVVKLSYVRSWFDFNINEYPPTVLIKGDEMTEDWMSINETIDIKDKQFKIMNSDFLSGLKSSLFCDKPSA